MQLLFNWINSGAVCVNYKKNTVSHVNPFLKHNILTGWYYHDICCHSSGRNALNTTPLFSYTTVKPTPAHHAMETVQLLQQKMSLFSSRQRNCCRLTTMQTGMKLNIVPDASVIAKFHYTDTDTDPNGTTRTQRSFAAKKSVSVSVSVSGPCRARVVEFSYYQAGPVRRRRRPVAGKVTVGSGIALAPSTGHRQQWFMHLGAGPKA